MNETTYVLNVKLTIENEASVTALTDQIKKSIIKGILEEQLKKINVSMTGAKVTPLNVEIEMK